MADLKAEEYKTFESIKRTHENGSDFWCARELAPVLDYAKWENFSKVIKRAMIAAETVGLRHQTIFLKSEKWSK